VNSGFDFENTITSCSSGQEKQGLKRRENVFRYSLVTICNMELYEKVVLELL